MGNYYDQFDKFQDPMDLYKQALGTAQQAGQVPQPGARDATPYPSSGSAGIPSATTPQAAVSAAPSLMKQLGKNAPNIAKYALIGAVAGQGGVPGIAAASALPFLVEMLKHGNKSATDMAKSKTPMSDDYYIPGEAKGGKVPSGKKFGGEISTKLAQPKAVKPVKQMKTQAPTARSVKPVAVPMKQISGPVRNGIGRFAKGGLVRGNGAALRGTTFKGEQ